MPIQISYDRAIKKLGNLPSRKIDQPKCWRCGCTDLRPVGYGTYACRNCGTTKQIRWREDVAESLGIALDPITRLPIPPEQHAGVDHTTQKESH